MTILSKFLCRLSLWIGNATYQYSIKAYAFSSLNVSYTILEEQLQDKWRRAWVYASSLELSFSERCKKPERWSYCSMWINVGNFKSLFNGGFWWFADNWCLWQSSWFCIRLRKMSNYVENLRACAKGTRQLCGSQKLDIILVIRNSALVCRIESLEADDPFKTVFQTKSFESFDGMDLIRISEDLSQKRRRRKH